MAPRRATFSIRLGGRSIFGRGALPGRRRLSGRILIAVFALWLPAATGQGGRATCTAAAAFAKTMSGARPHLSCHGENGARGAKKCCCNSETSIRAAACGCHDGQSAFGAAVHDPVLASLRWKAGAPLERRLARLPKAAAPLGESREPPDPPPPRVSPSEHA